MIALALVFALTVVAPAHAGAPPPVAPLVPASVSSSLSAIEELTPAQLGENANLAVTELKAMSASMQAIGADSAECVATTKHTFKLLHDLVVKSREALTPMIERNDRVHANAEFRKIVVALLRARALYTRTYQCAYDEATSGGTSSASSEYLGSELGSDLLDGALDSLDVGQAPPEASPFI